MKRCKTLDVDVLGVVPGEIDETLDRRGPDDLEPEPEDVTVGPAGGVAGITFGVTCGKTVL